MVLHAHYAPPAGIAQVIVVFIHDFKHCVRYEWAHGAFAACGVAISPYDRVWFALLRPDGHSAGLL